MMAVNEVVAVAEAVSEAVVAFAVAVAVPEAVAVAVAVSEAVAVAVSEAEAKAVAVAAAAVEAATEAEAVAHELCLLHAPAFASAVRDGASSVPAALGASVAPAAQEPGRFVGVARRPLPRS